MRAIDPFQGIPEMAVYKIYGVIRIKMLLTTYCQIFRMYIVDALG